MNKIITLFITISFLNSIYSMDINKDFHRTTIKEIKRNYRSPLEAIQTAIDFVKSMKYDMQECKELNIINREIVYTVSRKEAEEEYKKDFSRIKSHLRYLKKEKQSITNLLNVIENAPHRQAQKKLNSCFKKVYYAFLSINNYVDPRPINKLKENKIERVKNTQLLSMIAQQKQELVDQIVSIRDNREDILQQMIGTGLIRQDAENKLDAKYDKIYAKLAKKSLKEHKLSVIYNKIAFSSIFFNKKALVE